MRSIIFLALVLLALVLQTTALNFISVSGVIPDLVLVLIILNGFLRGSREGAFLGFVGGVLQDLVTGGYFGVHALTKMAAGYLAGLGEVRLYRENRVIAAGLTWFCTMGTQIIYYILLLMVNVQIPLVAAFVNIVLPVSFYNSLIVLLIYGFYYRSDRSGLLSGEER